ncbi:MAG: beta-ketoacyl-[acyl-carrier-protein] synthase II [Candidatus Aminicenantes bacterium RBG_16_63_14]|nr:MAG: beta-ketoacyl-[acyl-carrier-protein] synthase II [Candidatus Aminicenantes bacterium RBG_16_63_14]OGD27720.1 MAG: beta-ketoacyl-[acyl-carrier-protein] synthase II [Candidatus Aminicenantes bacterium RBG_19FT_COMBO_65_30]
MSRDSFPERRVVVTGIGLVSPLGVGTDKTWQALLRGESGIATLTRFDVSRYATRFGGEVKDFDPLLFIDRKEVRKMDPFIRFAMAAAVLAVDDSGVPAADLQSDRAGTYIGSGIGGLGSIEENHKVLLEKGPDRVSPFFLVQTIINEASGQVSIRYGAKGPNCANATACSTGTHAIGDSFRMIARGEADIMIAGGAEAPLTPLSLAGFTAIKALSERNDAPAKASRPFDARRDGFVMGEGAGVLILEELGRALRREARIYGEVVGYGLTSDAYHVAAPAPDGDGAARVMRRAIEDAGVRPEDIQYINAHGTSTPFNDKTETMAIKQVFGEQAARLAVNSTKSMTGHLLGAAGGLEAGVTALCLFYQIMPPTINYEFPDPECDLDYVPNAARKAEIGHALSNSFGFGGTNGALVFKRFERP